MAHSRGTQLTIRTPHLVKSVALWFILIAMLSLTIGLINYRNLVESGRNQEQVMHSRVVLHDLERCSAS